MQYEIEDLISAFNHAMVVWADPEGKSKIVENLIGFCVYLIKSGHFDDLERLLDWLNLNQAYTELKRSDRSLCFKLERMRAIARFQREYKKDKRLAFSNLEMYFRISCEMT